MRSFGCLRYNSIKTETNQGTVSVKTSLGITQGNNTENRPLCCYYSYSDTGVTGAKENAADGLPTRYTALGVNTDYSYDSLNRLTMRSVGVDDSIYTLYYYKTADNREGYTTTQVSSENIDGTIYAYTYDEMGNISTIKKNNVLYRSYEYDDLGQLTKETQHDNNKTIDYVYNHLGNISYKTETVTNPNTNSKVVGTIYYEYGKDGKDGWNYLLTGYNTNGGGVDENEKISYDNIGNPIVYRGAEMAWKGRQLTGYAKNGTMSTFSYDADGLRATKTVDGVKTVYQYVGDKLYYEKRGDSQEFYYFYDSYGNLASIYYTFSTDDYTSSANYYVTTNIQGDVTALYNSTGALVARYEYDAWGNVLSVKDANGSPITQWYHIANANPIRYRGYYYDSDLDLYYLQSRYYDSETGRFINADSYISTGIGLLGYNMFAYCNNSPVITRDENGDILCTILGASIGALTSVIFKSFETDDPEQLKAAAIGGAVSGAISGAASDILVCTGGTAGAFVFWGAVSGGLGSGLGTLAEAAYLNKDVPIDELWDDVSGDVISNAVIGTAFGAAFGAPNSTTPSLKETVIKGGEQFVAKTAVKAFVKDFTKNIIPNTIAELASNFFCWFSSLIFEATRELL